MQPNTSYNPDLRERLRPLIPEIEWIIAEPLIEEINRLKKKLGIAILAHTYQVPQIYHGVADIRGDSLALARKAAKVEAKSMIVCGVHFMAESAKLLNPDKTVLTPDPEAGCSLADSITAEDVRELRRRYPGVPVVSYVNTSAEVKAETDVCCTSANAVEIVEHLGSERVIFLPDAYLAAWVAANTRVEIIPWHGHCEVHEQLTPEMIRDYRAQFPGVPVLAHPECSMEVLSEADFVGSTSAMMNWVRRETPRQVVMMSECSMADNIAAEFPELEFLRPCTICPHMKKITLKKILSCLQGGGVEVAIPEEIASRARKSVERMLEVG